MLGCMPFVLSRLRFALALLVPIPYRPAIPDIARLLIVAKGNRDEENPAVNIDEID